jgi:hypothetical protein
MPDKLRCMTKVPLVERPWPPCMCTSCKLIRTLLVDVGIMLRKPVILELATLLYDRTVQRNLAVLCVAESMEDSSPREQARCRAAMQNIRNTWMTISHAD